MHNFPHQISNLAKFYQALNAFAALIEKGADVSDDETVGEALARTGVYAFREPGTVEQNLKKERAKPRANRGTHTAARDHRRFFLLCKLVQSEGGASIYSLTASAKALLAAPDGSARRSAWREAMNGLELGDAPTIVHPYRVLVRLVNTFPGIEKRRLLLALEANDDSDKEFARISTMSGLAFNSLMKALGVSEHGAANAVKILPSIAEQLGDMKVEDGRCYPTVKTLITEDGPAVAAPTPVFPTIANLIPVSADSIAAIPAFGDTTTSPVDLTAGIEARKKRTEEHQKAVKSLAKLLQKSKYKLHEYPFDILAVTSDSKTVLVEVKTLDGTPVDERQQAERAVGQLKAYRYFAVPNELSAHEQVDLAAFTRRPAKSTIEFMRQCGIKTAWLDGDVWMTRSGKADVQLIPQDLF